MSTKILDHIVHLTPPGSVSETVKQWEKLGFKVIPGGTHADGLTENALVILSDRIYIELISFTHPVSHYPPGSSERRARESHAWASKQPGWIDFAYLGFGSSNPPPSDDVSLEDVINGRAEKEGSGTVYDKTVPGGRTRPDGTVLKWRITAPSVEKHGRGVLPFFCGDVTERQLRVPANDSSTVHHNTSKGIAHIGLLTSASEYDTIKSQLTSVIGSPPSSSSSTTSVWDLEAPQAETDLAEPCHHPQIVLHRATSDEHKNILSAHGRGVYEVAFRVEVGHEGEAESPYGRVVWTEK